MDANTIAGFVGVAIVVSAYFANQQGWLKSEDWRFPGANLIGSLLILASLWTAWNSAGSRDRGDMVGNQRLWA